MSMIDYGDEVTIAEQRVEAAIADLNEAKFRYSLQIAEMMLQSMSLVEDAARLYEENDKLRERIGWLEKGDVLHVLTDQEYIERGRREREMQASIDALDRDNAELRELCRDMRMWVTLAPPTSVDDIDDRLLRLGIHVWD